MNQSIPRRSRPILMASMAALLFSASTALAATVSMPTPQGSRAFDSDAFAFATLAGPSGEFGCFTAGVLSACSPASLQIAALGPDLTTGLTLGPASEVTLALPMIGSSLAIWEAGNFTVENDVSDALVSVHTTAGWTTFRSFGSGNIAPVLNDTQPSGYQTNFGTFSASDLGLVPDALFDAVRIQSCCGADSHFDILAVAVAGTGAVAAVPEPSTSALLLSGLLAIVVLARRCNTVDCNGTRR